MIKIRMKSNFSIGPKDYVAGQELIVNLDTYELLRDSCIRLDAVDRDLRLMKSVLVCKSNGLGNVINITPVIKKIKLVNPDIAIDMLVLPAYVDIFKAMSQIRTVYTPETLEQADRGQWDLVVQGIPADFALPGVPSDKVITGEKDWFKTRHEVEANIKILTPCIDSMEYIPDTFITIPEAVKAEVNAMLPAGKYIGINAGYTKNQDYWKIKHWGDDKYAELVRILLKNFPKHRIIIMGTAGEDGFIKDLPERVQSFAGKLSILQTAYLLSRMDFIVSNDSGNAHLASAVGTRTFVIFGPTSFIKNHPWKNSTIIRRDLDCSPCQFSKGWPVCKSNHACMEIMASEVSQTIKESKKEKELAIIVNSYNRYDFIVSFLNNLQAWEGAHDIRLIVIDDCSESDRILKAVESFRSPWERSGNELVFIRHDHNYGREKFPQSIQEGIEAATGCKYTLFTSEDVNANRRILAQIRAAYPLLDDMVQCINFFIDTRIYGKEGKGGIYTSHGKHCEGYEYVKWNDGFLTLYRTSFLSDIKIYGMPSDMGSGIWFCVNKFITAAGLKQIRTDRSFAEHVGNIKSTMNDQWRKENPIEAVNVKLW